MDFEITFAKGFFFNKISFLSYVNFLNILIFYLFVPQRSRRILLSKTSEILQTV